MATAEAVTLPTDGAGDGTSNPTGTVKVMDQIACLALAWDPVGIPWLLVINGDETTPLPAYAGYVYCYYSPDGGINWDTASTRLPDGTVWNAFDYAAGLVLENYPKNWGACWQRGRLVWAHDWYANSGNFDASIGLAYLGGWSDLGLSAAGGGQQLGSRSAWTWTWLPYERPDDQNYTTTSAGTSSSTLNAADGGVHILTTGDGVGAAGQHFFSVGAGATAVQYGELEWEMSHYIGGGSGAT